MSSENEGDSVPVSQRARMYSKRVKTGRRMVQLNDQTLTGVKVRASQRQRKVGPSSGSTVQTESGATQSTPGGKPGSKRTIRIRKSVRKEVKRTPESALQNKPQEFDGEADESSNRLQISADSSWTAARPSVRMIKTSISTRRRAYLSAPKAGGSADVAPDETSPVPHPRKLSSRRIRVKSIKRSTPTDDATQDTVTKTDDVVKDTSASTELTSPYAQRKTKRSRILKATNEQTAGSKEEETKFVKQKSIRVVRRSIRVPPPSKEQENETPEKPVAEERIHLAAASPYADRPKKIRMSRFAKFDTGPGTRKRGENVMPTSSQNSLNPPGSEAGGESALKSAGRPGKLRMSKMVKFEGKKVRSVRRVVRPSTRHDVSIGSRIKAFKTEAKENELLTPNYRDKYLDKFRSMANDGDEATTEQPKPPRKASRRIVIRKSMRNAPSVAARSGQLKEAQSKVKPETEEARRKRIEEAVKAITRIPKKLPQREFSDPETDSPVLSSDENVEESSKDTGESTSVPKVVPKENSQEISDSPDCPVTEEIIDSAEVTASEETVDSPEVTATEETVDKSKLITTEETVDSREVTVTEETVASPKQIATEETVDKFKLIATKETVDSPELIATKETVDSPELIATEKTVDSIELLAIEETVDSTEPPDIKQRENESAAAQVLYNLKEAEEQYAQETASKKDEENSEKQNVGKEEFGLEKQDSLTRAYSKSDILDFDGEDETTDVATEKPEENDPVNKKIQMDDTMNQTAFLQLQEEAEISSKVEAISQKANKTLPEEPKPIFEKMETLSNPKEECFAGTFVMKGGGTGDVSDDSDSDSSDNGVINEKWRIRKRKKYIDQYRALLNSDPEDNAEEEEAFVGKSNEEIIAEIEKTKSLIAAIKLEKAKNESPENKIYSSKQPEPDSLKQPEPDSLKQSEPDSVKESEPDSLNQPEPDSLKQSEPDSLKQPEPNSLKQPEPDFLKQPEPDSLKQPEPNSLKQPEPDSLKQSEPDSLKEPEPDSFKHTEPVPVDDNQTNTSENITALNTGDNVELQSNKTKPEKPARKKKQEIIDQVTSEEQICPEKEESDEDKGDPAKEERDGNSRKEEEPGGEDAIDEGSEYEEVEYIEEDYSDAEYSGDEVVVYEELMSSEELEDEENELEYEEGEEEEEEGDEEVEYVYVDEDGNEISIDPNDAEIEYDEDGNQIVYVTDSEEEGVEYVTDDDEIGSDDEVIYMDEDGNYVDADGNPVDYEPGSDDEVIEE